MMGWKVMTKIKKNFITGFISLLPTFATLYVIIFAYKFIAEIVQLIVPIELISNLLVSLHKDLEKVALYNFDVEIFLNSIDAIKELIKQNT